MESRTSPLAIAGGIAGVLLVLAAVGFVLTKHGGVDLPRTGQWQTVEHTDKMSGAKSQDAEASVTADDGEPFDVAASCAPGFINFTVTATEKDAKIEVKQTQNGDEAFFLRTRLDDGDVTTAHSAVDYNNEASIFFYDPDIAPKSIADGLAGNFGRTVASASADKDEQSTGQTVAKFAGALTGLFAGSVLQTAGAGTIKNLEAASSLHIEVPMADDRKPMITIALGDPTLQHLFGECRRAAAAQYPPSKASEPASDDSGAPAPNAPTPSPSIVPDNDMTTSTTTTTNSDSDTEQATTTTNSQ